VTIQSRHGDRIEVPLSSREAAAWCVICKVANDGQGLTVTNLNRVGTDMPRLDDF